MNKDTVVHTVWGDRAANQFIRNDANKKEVDDADGGAFQENLVSSKLTQG